MKACEWKPIEDLPEDWTKLASSELGGLASVWREHYETVKDGKALKQFNERLRREWAIETGIIENLYYIDRGTTETLIKKGIEASLIPHGSTDRPAELIVPILKDQEEVITGLFDFVGQQQQLSTSYIKQLHQALTQHQRTTAAKDSFGNMVEVELQRGDWKKLPNNPTKSDGSLHEYCPPEQVASEIDRLIALHQEHLKKGVTPEVEAAWLHHRFTQIHPFQDGNGRMARTLASLIFLRERLFPLVINRGERNEYIEALENADQGDLKLLVQFFSRTQKKAINQAVSLSEYILLEGAVLEKIIIAATDHLKNQKQQQFKSATLATKIAQLAEERLSATAKLLRENLQTISKDYDAESLWVHDKMDIMHFYEPTQKIAKSAGYEANFSNHSSWLILELRHGFSPRRIVISFHGVGNAQAIAVAAFFLQSTTWETNSTNEIVRPMPAYSLSPAVFQFTESEPEVLVFERFEKWINEVMLNGVDIWRRQL